MWIEPVDLAGSVVALVPLSHAHAPSLREAVQDGQLWTLWYTRIPSPELVEAEIDRRLALQRTGSMLAFAVLEKSTGRAIGMTSYMNIEQAHRRLEIGSTWYRASAQRTCINTECKLLLLTHAFDVLRCIAVEFRTSSMNLQSRRAIERLGAKLDGILRSHQIVEGDVLRDTVVYSIIASEWPAVRKSLAWRLAKGSGSSFPAG